MRLYYVPIKVQFNDSCTRLTPFVCRLTDYDHVINGDTIREIDWMLCLLLPPTTLYTTPEDILNSKQYKEQREQLLIRVPVIAPVPDTHTDTTAVCISYAPHPISYDSWKSKGLTLTDTDVAHLTILWSNV